MAVHLRVVGIYARDLKVEYSKLPKDPTVRDVMEAIRADPASGFDFLADDDINPSQFDRENATLFMVSFYVKAAFESRAKVKVTPGYYELVDPQQTFGVGTVYSEFQYYVTRPHPTDKEFSKPVSSGNAFIAFGSVRTKDRPVIQDEDTITWRLISLDSPFTRAKDHPLSVRKAKLARI